MWGVEYPSFKEFREEDIVSKSIKFRLADEMWSSVMVSMYMGPYVELQGIISINLGEYSF